MESSEILLTVCIPYIVVSITDIFGTNNNYYASLGDIGAVFGIGFPPFIGGPFRLLDSVGTSSFVDRMYRYRDAKGPQFEPAQILKDYAASGKKFHS